MAKKVRYLFVLISTPIIIALTACGNERNQLSQPALAPPTANLIPTPASTLAYRFGWPIRRSIARPDRNSVSCPDRDGNSYRNPHSHT